MVALQRALKTTDPFRLSQQNDRRLERLWLLANRVNRSREALPHPRAPGCPDQSLDPFAVDPVPPATQAQHDPAATVERVPGVFGVNQSQQCPFLLVRCGGWQATILNYCLEIGAHYRESISPQGLHTYIREMGDMSTLDPQLLEMD